MFPVFEKLGGLDPALDLIAELRGRRPAAISLYRWKTSGLPGWLQIRLATECKTRGIDCTFDDMKWNEPSKSERAA